MPAAWTAKDERQYGHILKSCKKRGSYGVKRCKSIAAATVNKRRRKEGRTLSGMPGYEKLVGRPFWKNGACWQKYEDGDTGKVSTRKISPGVCKMLGLSGLDAIGSTIPLAFAVAAGVVLIGVAQKAAALKQ
jgi:hypothetical protein